MEGEKLLHKTNQANQIETFATKIGVARVANGATVCLLLNYLHAILTGALSNQGAYHRVPMIGGHLALAAILMGRFTQLDPESISSIKVYYKHIWDLFYLEYGLYTLI
jgi:homogentisate solanesyltransferase